MLPRQRQRQRLRQAGLLVSLPVLLLLPALLLVRVGDMPHVAAALARPDVAPSRGQARGADQLKPPQAGAPGPHFVSRQSWAGQGPPTPPRRLVRPSKHMQQL